MSNPIFETARRHGPPGSRSPDPEETLTALWLEATRECYLLAKAERLGELKGKRIKLLDARGMHPYSVAWGRVLALEELLPALAGARLADPPTDPVHLRRVAQRDAESEFHELLRAEGPGVFA